MRKVNEINTSGRRPLSLKGRFLSIPTLLSFGLVAAILALSATRFELDWSRTSMVIRNSNPWWFLLAFAVHYTTFIFRGLRWRLLLNNAAQADGSDPPQSSTLYFGGLILISWFANSITWFRLGDAYRAYAYAEDTGTGFPRAIGTVVADRVIDVVVVFVLLVVGAVTLYVSGQVRPSPVFLVLGAVLLVGILVTLLAMYLLRRWVVHRLPSAIEAAYYRFHGGTMGSLKRLHLVFLLGVLGWLSEVGRLFLVLHALGIPLALGLVLFVTLANGLLSAVPLTPGGLGIVEAGITGLLMLSVSREEAVVVALLDRSISYLSIVILGGVVFVLRQARSTRKIARTAQ